MNKKLFIVIIVILMTLIVSCSKSGVNNNAAQVNPKGILTQIEKKGVIKIATAYDAEPWQFKDIKGKPAGATLDIQRLIAKELGVKLEISDQAFATLIPGLLTNKADIVATTLSVTNERAKQIRFVDERVYTTGAQVFIRTEDKENLTDYTKFINEDFKLGAVAGTFLEETAKTYFPAAKILSFDSDIDLFQALLTKKVDAVVNSETTQVIIDANYPGKMLAVEIPRKLIEEDSWAYAVRPEDEYMAYFLDIVLKKAKSSGKIQAIYDYWTGSDLYRKDFFKDGKMSSERENLINFLGISEYDPYFATGECLSYEK